MEPLAFRFRILVMIAVMCGACGEAQLDQLNHGGGSKKVEPAPMHPVGVGAFAEVSAGWPAAAEVAAMAHFNGILYAVVRSGGTRSLQALAEGATQWKPVALGLAPSEEVVSVVKVDLAIYVSAGNDTAGTGGLYRLDIASDQFTRLGTLPSGAPSALVKRGSQLLVAVSGVEGGVFASSDRGASWTRRASNEGENGFLRRPVRQFAAAAAAQRIFATGEIASHFGGLYFSDDDGAHWRAAPISGDVLALHAASELMLVDVTVDGPQRSDNYGATFHPAVGVNGAQSFLISDSLSYAGTAQGLKVSADRGLTWAASGEGLPAGAEVSDLYLAGTQLFTVTPGRVFVAGLQSN